MYKYLYIWIWSVILNAKGENRESQNYTTKYKDISKDSCSTSIQPSSCKLLLCGPAATLTANSHVDGANIANLSSPRVSKVSPLPYSIRGLFWTISKHAISIWELLRVDGCSGKVPSILCKQGKRGKSLIKANRQKNAQKAWNQLRDISGFLKHGPQTCWRLLCSSCLFFLWCHSDVACPGLWGHCTPRENQGFRSSRTRDHEATLAIQGTNQPRFA